MTEDQLEQEALGWLREIGYSSIKGTALAPDGEAPERTHYTQPLLIEHLRSAIARLNPAIPAAAREDAVKQVMDLGTPVMLAANRHFHRLLVGGVPVQSSSSLPIATIWTGNYSASFHWRKTCCANSRCRPPAGAICA